MTKNDLSQLRAMKKEIELLQESLKDIKPEYVSDMVIGSSKHFPYTAHPIKIEGIDVESYNAKRQRLIRQIRRRMDELLDAVLQAEAFIETVEDSLVRQIITLRYVRACTWEEVAAKMGGGNSTSAVRMQHDRYFKKI